MSHYRLIIIPLEFEGCFEIYNRFSVIVGIAGGGVRLPPVE